MFMLLEIKLFVLSIFVQVDKNRSLQRSISDLNSNGPRDAADNSDAELYSHLLLLSDKALFKTGLSFPEILFLAKYYVSYKNERDGRTVRYSESYTPLDDDFGGPKTYA